MFKDNIARLLASANLMFIDSDSRGEESFEGFGKAPGEDVGESTYW